MFLILGQSFLSIWEAALVVMPAIKFLAPPFAILTILLAADLPPNAKTATTAIKISVSGIAR